MGWSGEEQPAKEAEGWLVMGCAVGCSMLGCVFSWLSIPACVQLQVAVKEAPVSSFSEGFFLVVLLFFGGE